MKTCIRSFKSGAALSPAIAAICLASLLTAVTAAGQTNDANSMTGGASGGSAGMSGKTVEITAGDGSNSQSTVVAGWATPDQKQILVNRLGPIVNGNGWHGPREVTWLGVATEEAPEVLTSQMGLDPGVGLVVTYVETNSPAAKAGLQKNDVLIEFQGQSLVVAEQLRKLVQVRKEGDTVKLTLYRAGKKQTVSVTLGKTRREAGFQSGGAGFDDFFLKQSENPPPGTGFRSQLQMQREPAGKIKIDEKRVQEEIRRNLEQSRRLYETIQRQASNANPNMEEALKRLAAAEAAMDKQASITVRSTGRSAKSLVTADESGTIVLVSNPKLHLTAHDVNGKLLFDGEIETPDERAKVPADLWQKVEPLVKKMASEEKDKSFKRPVTPKVDS